MIAYLDCDDEFYPYHLQTVDEWAPKGDVLFFAY